MGFGREVSLVSPRDVLPTQADRQVDSSILPQSGGGSSIQFPFQLSDATVVAGTVLLGVRSGTMQDMVPTGGVGSTISLGSAGTYAVYLDTTIDINGLVTAVAIVADISGTQPANTDYDGYITLGTVVVASVAGNLTITMINQFCTHSLRCGIAGRQVVAGVLTAPGTFEFWGF